MQTKSVDALRLWWRDINFTQSQRRALAGFALLAVAIRGILSFLTWFEKQEEVDWSDEEEFEEVI